MDKITKTNFLSKGPFVPVYMKWFNELVDEVNAIVTSTRLDVDYDAGVGATDPMIDLDADVVGVAYKAINLDIDITTTGLTADAVYGSYFDITGLATDNDTSTLTSYFSQITAVAGGRADSIGFLAGTTGSRTTADTDQGFISGFSNYTLNNASATAYGYRMGGISGTGAHTDGTFYGYYAGMTNAVASGNSFGICVSAATIGVTNAHYGANFVKTLTNSTAVGAVAQRADTCALQVAQTSATSAAASGATTVANDAVYFSIMNSTAVASSDVWSGRAFYLFHANTTTGTGTAAYTGTTFKIDTVLTETAGTLSCNDFDVANITLTTAGTPAFADGYYNLLKITATTGASIDAAATAVLIGTNINMSGVIVTDAQLNVIGLSVTMGAPGAGSMIGVWVSNGTSTVGLLYNTTAVYATDGTYSVSMCDATDAIVYTGRLRDGYTIGDAKSSAYNNVKTLKYTVGVLGAAGVDYNFASAANHTEQSIRLGGAFNILPAYSRVIDVVVLCTENLSSGAATGTCDVGLTSGSNEFISAGAVDDANEIVGLTTGGGPIAQLSASAQSVYFSFDPDTNWDDASMTTGKWTIWISYIDNSTTAVN